MFKKRKSKTKKGRSFMTKMIPFKSQGPVVDDADGEVVDHGTVGGLTYKAFKRGTIHITDGTLTFKKGIDLFEDALNAIDFGKMADGDSKRIEGSGDNDHLVFTIKDGTMELSLFKRGHGVIEKLKEVINRNRSNRKVGS